MKQFECFTAYAYLQGDYNYNLHRRGALHMASCVRCQAQLSFFENMGHLGKQKFCSSCEQHIDATLQGLNQQLLQASAHNDVTERFRHYVRQQLASNRIPPERSAEIIRVVDYQKYLTDIRQGNLPNIFVHAILDTDEVAHLETLATYYKPNKQIKLVQGRLIATSKKLYLITPDRDSMKIDWNNVVNVDEVSGQDPNGRPAQLMYIQVSKGPGGGAYEVVDPTMTVAIISTAVKMWKRHLVELKANPNTQGVPEHVKAAVFKRDGGRCRQCGYMGPYIEYDHIIPRSKGGPNTVQNIQLLCRQCNLKKSNRI
jgi:hypothetical protein